MEDITADSKIDIIESAQGYSRVLDYVDLFDEGRFGADKLFLRGSFSCLDNVREQVNSFLTGTDTKDEEGYDLPIYATPAIAREISDKNRLFDPNRRIWKLSEATDEKYPYKSQYRLMFFIKLHFHTDFAYIWFGVPWSNPKAQDELNAGQLNPIKDTYDLSDLKLLKHVWISPEDAKIIVDYIAARIDSIDNATPADQVLSAFSSISNTNLNI